MFPGVNSCLAFGRFLLPRSPVSFYDTFFFLIVSGDFLLFWPELAAYFTLGPLAHLLLATERDRSFLYLSQSSPFLVCYLAWQELSYGFLKIKHGVAHKRLVTAGLSLVVPGKAAPTWAACPGSSVTTIQADALLPPVVSQAFLIFKEHLPNWLIRKGHTGGNYLWEMHLWKQFCSTLKLPSNPYSKCLGPEVLRSVSQICIIFA